MLFNVFLMLPIIIVCSVCRVSKVSQIGWQSWPYSRVWLPGGGRGFGLKFRSSLMWFNNVISLCNFHFKSAPFFENSYWRLMHLSFSKSIPLGDRYITVWQANWIVIDGVKVGLYQQLVMLMYNFDNHMLQWADTDLLRRNYQFTQFKGWTLEKGTIDLLLACLLLGTNQHMHSDHLFPLQTEQYVEDIMHLSKKFRWMMGNG